jgi:hypothetical protein
MQIMPIGDYLPPKNYFFSFKLRKYRSDLNTEEKWDSSKEKDAETET